MLELITQKLVPLCGPVHRLEVWVRNFAHLGADLNPFIFDPECEEAPDRDALIASGLDDDDVHEIVSTSRNDFHDPAELLTVLQKSAEIAGRIVTPEKDRQKVLRDIFELTKGCEAAHDVGEQVQIFASAE